MRRILGRLAEECRIGLFLLVAGLSAAAVHGQPGAYGQSGPPGQYSDDWDDTGYDEYDGYDDYDSYDDYDDDGYGGGYDASDRYDRYDPSNRNGRRYSPAAEVGFFYNELSPYGDWVRHRQYGWVWFPRHTYAGWRPYSAGRWVESEYGWMWVSEEPFGWATYHYGRWAWDRRVGWLWVPGTVWAPAWVAWQQGNGYVGWAPLPPAVGFDARIGIRLGGFNLSLGIAPTRYTFVDERRFLDNRIRNYIVPEARNVTIIRNTTNITNYTVVNNRVINHGVPVERITRATGRRPQRLRVATTSNPRTASVQRDVVQVYRPPESKLETVKVAPRNNAGLKQEKRANKRAERPEGKPNPSASDRKTPRPQAVPVPRGTVQREKAPVPIPVAPRAQPSPQKVDEKQFTREQRQLQSNLEKERRELEQAQRQEKTRNKANADAKELEQRHSAELKAQQAQRERAAQQLRNRQQLERQAAEVSKPEARDKQQPPAEKRAKAAKQDKKADSDKNRNKNKKNPQGDNQKPPKER